MSDGAKEVRSKLVRSLLDYQGLQRARFSWHIIRKNRETANVGWKDEDLKLIWKVVRSRMRDRSALPLADLAGGDSDLSEWFGSHPQHSGAYKFLTEKCADWMFIRQTVANRRTAS